MSYEIPTPGNIGGVGRHILHDWSIDTFLKARSGFGLNVVTGQGGFDPDRGVARADATGAPFYIDDSNAAGGKRLNPDAFASPEEGQQGTLGRNVVRGFNLFQWDFTVRRKFTITEDLDFQFRADFFNILNHPNFSQPVSNMENTTQFGQAISMLNNGLSPGIPDTGFSSFYQIGGPRSIQFALKFLF